MVCNLIYKSPSVNILGDFFILNGELMERIIALKEDICGYLGLILLLLAFGWFINYIDEMRPYNDYASFEEGVPQCETTQTRQHDIIVEKTTCITIHGVQK